MLFRLVAWFTACEQGKYWILRIDPDDRWFMVGTPDREDLWILSHSLDLEEPSYQELVAFNRQLGYPNGQLIRAPMTQ
ncbi:MAG TPA: lipocalin family protein [Nitrospira sp.]|nr:lipocalin family protein [Nitrospira sp.]